MTEHEEIPSAGPGDEIKPYKIHVSLFLPFFFSFYFFFLFFAFSCLPRRPRRLLLLTQMHRSRASISS